MQRMFLQTKWHIFQGNTVLLRINAGGVHLIFYIFPGRLFKGGVYTREAFIKKYRKNYNSMYQRQ